jgi:hypothetical protein
MNLPAHEAQAQKHVLFHVDEPVVGMFGTSNLYEPPTYPTIGYKYTLEVRNKIGFIFSDFYYEHILSALLKLNFYKDFASGHCAANNITDRFNEWFADVAYQGFPQLNISGEIEAEFPWVVAPTVFTLTQELLDNAYDGQSGRMIAEIKRIADSIEPRNGTLTNLENFVDDFTELAARYFEEFKGEEVSWLPGVYDFNTGGGLDGTIETVEKEFARTIDLSVEFDAFEAMYQRGLDKQMQELWQIHQEAMVERLKYEDAQDAIEDMDENIVEAARIDCNCKIKLCDEKFCERFPAVCQIINHQESRGMFGYAISANSGAGVDIAFGNSQAGNVFTGAGSSVTSDDISDYFDDDVSGQAWTNHCGVGSNSNSVLAGFGQTRLTKFTEKCSDFLESRMNTGSTGFYDWWQGCKDDNDKCHEKLASSDCEGKGSNKEFKDDGYGWDDALDDFVEGSSGMGGTVGGVINVIKGLTKKK